MRQRTPYYANEAFHGNRFTKKNDILYSKLANVYDLLIHVLPTWKRWISFAVPHIQGTKVLEISFGTGLLLKAYAHEFEVHGVDYNLKMVSLAKKKLASRDVPANLIRGNVEALPYGDNTFDSIVVTMAFTGYPDGVAAMTEIHRVLKTGGRLIMVDINYPKNLNVIGFWMTRIWMLLGDIVRDMDALFTQFYFEYTDQEIGGFGSVHLYIAKKR